MRCAPEYLCDRADGAPVTPATPDEVAKAAQRAMTAPRKAPESQSQGRASANLSLPLAKAAKAQLEAVGWVVEGKAGFSDDDYWAGITASRDAETLVMHWVGTELIAQNYSFEYLKPSRNTIPGTQLDFDPAELTDSELVRMVKGMRVTWWNTLASSTETAIVGDKVTIEHIFYASGDEDNSKRIVKFLDRNGGGFRAFHVNALMKLG